MIQVPPQMAEFATWMNASFWHAMLVTFVLFFLIVCTIALSRE